MATPERYVIENLFRVVNKASQDVPFLLNSAQRVIDDQWHRRLIIPKARQEGVSTYFLARSAVKCMGVKNTRAVVISHDSESTERMLDKVKYFLETIKGPKPLIRNSSKNELTFPKTNSMFFIGTAGARSFGRGDLITDLHCSEVAYWPDPKRLMTGLFGAVPKVTGCVSIESTGNGAGNWYHAQCMRAAKGQGMNRLLFLPWQTFPEYTIDLSAEETQTVLANLREDLKEPDVMRAYGLTAGQILWRRSIIEDELDGDLFEWNKEYPSCLDDCFQTAGGGIFQSVRYVETPDWQRESAFLHVMKGHPQPHLHYLVGGDVSAGVGKDSSVAEVFCLETEEQVAEYINSRIEPDAFADVLADLGYRFNEGYLGVESNNHGILTLKELGSYDLARSKVKYPTNKVYRTPAAKRSSGDQVKRLIDLGVRTSSRSKPIIIGTLRIKLRDSATIHSSILKNELSTYIEWPDGTMGAAENCHDDTVIAAGMAFFVRDRGALNLLEQPITKSELYAKKDPFALDSIIAEMTNDRAITGVNEVFPAMYTMEPF